MPGFFLVCRASLSHKKHKHTGGPAHNSGELDKGDYIICVDDNPVAPGEWSNAWKRARERVRGKMCVCAIFMYWRLIKKLPDVSKISLPLSPVLKSKTDTIHQHLLGSDIPGSSVILTVRKTCSGMEQTVLLIRMPTAEIAGELCKLHHTVHSLVTWKGYVCEWPDRIFKSHSRVCLSEIWSCALRTRRRQGLVWKAWSRSHLWALVGEKQCFQMTHNRLWILSHQDNWWCYLECFEWYTYRHPPYIRIFSLTHKHALITRIQTSDGCSNCLQR